MRGRQPRPLALCAADVPVLEALVRDGGTAQRVARRAAILLARAAGERVGAVARRVGRDPATVRRVCRRYEARGLAAVYPGPGAGRPRVIPPLARARLENLACSDPAASGRPLTRWSARSLQQAAVDAGIVPAIHYTTVAAILRRADLQPHRWRYWKTARWDPAAVARAARVLWCYERVDWLLARGEVVVGLDEIPNLQALERAGPTLRPAPGRIERREFEYGRHGTVNWLAALGVHDGRMWGTELGANDGAHFRPAAARLFEAYGWAKRMHLILDAGPSHTAADTLALFADRQPWLRALFTPARSSWLNQAELLLRAFGARYLDGGSWTGRDALLAHLHASRDDYNARFAHPFAWAWTRRDFRLWLASATPIPRSNSATDH
jgi:transposase